MSIRTLRRWGLALASLGILGILVLHALVFFWVPTEASQGIIQMIFYMHVPAAVVGMYVAFGILAITSALYLWLGDDKLDQAAMCAAEGGMVFLTVVLLTGPLWGKIAWGTYWTWDPRLTLTLLLWFIYLGYFLVRTSTQNPERGKRFAAVVGIVGALDIPLIHLSVVWFRSLHPGPVVMKPGTPTLAPQMLTTFLVGMFSFILLFLGVFALRYALETATRAAAVRARAART
jgi:heme exporter protein C